MDGGCDASASFLRGRASVILNFLQNLNRTSKNASSCNKRKARKALCLVCGAIGEYQNLMQEAVPGVIENHSK